MLLKDGFLYKKVSLDSLNFWDVVPTEEELLKFGPSKNSESNDMEWLSNIYGDSKKKRVIIAEKGGDGKGEGSLASGAGNDFELYALVRFRKKEENCVIISTDKDGTYKHNFGIILRSLEAALPHILQKLLQLSSRSYVQRGKSVKVTPRFHENRTTTSFQGSYANDKLNRPDCVDSLVNNHKKYMSQTVNRKVVNRGYYHVDTPAHVRQLHLLGRSWGSRQERTHLWFGHMRTAISKMSAENMELKERLKTNEELIRASQRESRLAREQSQEDSRLLREQFQKFMESFTQSHSYLPPYGPHRSS
ncbi:hypothetical protein MTR_5g062110 [Medicago truncatula]|uniref:Uncharacterized protein n=1 Tax=Medicago truncatula TaxID=3880 RepID=G7KA46_MEDTR|nr:hypothetical protein MTR_5g062110 [Medicago truncatula]